MNVERVRLEELRDQALRDLIELDRQVGDREIPPDAAAALRRRYEVTAARALTALDATAPSTTTATRARPRLSQARIVAYALTALAAVVAAAVLLPQFVLQRPAGGFVTGNEVAQAAPFISTSQLEAAVVANPNVVPIRLALAERYASAGDYGKAAGQYDAALRQDPGNVEARAHIGALLLRSGRPAEALRSVELALNADPSLLDAQWFKANIQLYGLGDPAATLTTLAGIRRRTDLSAQVAQQVDDLAAVARARLPGSRR